MAGLYLTGTDHYTAPEWGKHPGGGGGGEGRLQYEMPGCVCWGLKMYPL